MKGIIFNIQKFSIHDGPGIRTTIFLKGCPLRCKWCSNPESQSSSIQILHNKETCIHCLSCIKECPNNAIEHNKCIHINENKCTSCLKCINACPTHSLTISGEEKDIDEIVSTCLQDKDFYLESNGGVTLSGGEGLFQSDFVKHLVVALHKHDLHVAIETTGFINDITFQSLAPYFDLLLFDLKHYDSTKHKEGTGANNGVIIRNLKWLSKQDIPFLVRIPVIPYFNDSLYDAHNFSLLLNELGIKEVQLLPFHQMGEKKYELLNRVYLYKNIPPLHEEELTKYQEVFISHNIHCFF